LAVFGAVAPQYCLRLLRNLESVAGDSPAPFQGNSAMSGSPGATGFDGRATPVASSRLIHAVAASLAIGGLSLCLVVTITVLSVSIAMPIPV
jgi:hypothetical protein